LQGRITLDRDPLYEVAAPDDTLLRGAVYDDYTGSGWRSTPAGAVELVAASVEAAQLGTPASRASLQEAVRVDVTVLHESAPRDVLLGAGDPIASDREADLLLDRAGGPLQLRTARALPVGESYTTVSTRSVAAASTLEAAGQNYPATIVGRYLTLPDNFAPEVQALTLSVMGSAENPYHAARLVEAYLRSNYRFSLDVDAPPPGSDAVQHFLFDARVGYFDHFASAMAVMLRSVGIPSRVAVGFVLDRADYDTSTRTYRVTEERAWAWPEVYFPGLGWVEFNPTPGRPIPVRPGDDSVARSLALDDQEFSGLFFGDDFSGLGDEFYVDDFNVDLAFGSTADDPVNLLLARIIGWTLVAATVLLAGVVVVRLLWERAFRGMDVRAKRWSKLLWFAAFAGLRPASARTPAEVAADLAERTGEPEAWHAVARAYTRTRYGGPDVVAESEEDAETQTDHYRRLRRLLVGMALRRVTRFGRVAGGPLSRRSLATGGRTRQRL
jgi:transglutaminase-like putative cysteine protease